MLTPSLLLTFCVILPFTFLIWTLISLCQNIQIARQSRIPYIITLIDQANPLRMLFGNRLLNLLSPLPFTSTLIRREWHGWSANERYNAHATLGDIFLVLTPFKRAVYIADPHAIAEILRRKDDFSRDLKSMEVLNVYGRSLSTTEGSEWMKHRKVTAVTFTERNCGLVWEESLRQAEGMLEYWEGMRVVRSLREDANAFTLNVLAAALFAKPYPFRREGEGRRKGGNEDMEDETDAAAKYRESLSTILENIIAVFVFGGDVLSKAWMPEKMRRAGQAVHSYRFYAMSLIEEEKKRIRHGEKRPTTPSLVNLLVRACEEEDKDHSSNGKTGSRNTLTEAEIVSNLFVFAFAGNDTTAITFAHTLVFLAAHPHIQDWIHEEIQWHLPSPDISSWDYSAFPKLKRCLAVVMESLRMCHPLSLLMKQTGGQGRPIQVNDKTYVVPPNTVVSANMSALHTHPGHWGADAFEFKPSRFIDVTKESGEADPFDGESIKPDTTLEYVAWSSGQRACPGKKFSQVELVAALARLFHAHRIEAVPERGESAKEAAARLHRVGTHISMTLLMNVTDSRKAGVRWVRRHPSSA